MVDINTLKNTLRQQFLQERHNLSEKQSVKLQNSTFDNFHEHFSSIKPTSIAGYIAIKNELNIIELLNKLENNNHTILLPNITDRDEMQFCKWSIYANLVSGKFNIPTPENTTEIATPNIVIAPLLACDISGNRLGYGKGFYDRAITKLRANHNIIFAGICYEFQLIKEIPITQSDQRLDLIITDKRIIKISNALE